MIVVKALCPISKQREQRVNELETVLKNKDQAVLDLKKKLQDALFNFENKGLTITQKKRLILSTKAILWR